MFNETTMKLNIDPLLLSALREDISNEDISACSVVGTSQKGTADLICKENGVLCGIDIFFRIFTLLDSGFSFTGFFSDGDAVHKGDVIAEIKGNLIALLSGERTALNYLQRMSGIATYTNKTVALLGSSKTKLLDTRKTTPNNRIFEKYAAKIGGAQNHRYNLSDAIMLKDNHISAAGSIASAVEKARRYGSFVNKIEVETENLEMVKEALEAGADIIMLDNMPIEMMKSAIKMINNRALIEISGNVNEETLPSLANLGADYISMGALTHSAPILDFSLKSLKAIG
ncbi:nicotinate-nucleotide pyrophosphorylase [carboxylating] [Peptostreptococcaceae bacterium pGA-8]|nr:nicotinate-nucleotide pyrophosphorylase [carboxylating] [Peptostreptococcaceae bacterium pGA-8]